MKHSAIKLIFIGLAIGIGADLAIGLSLNFVFWFQDSLNDNSIYAYIYLLPLIVTIPAAIGITFAIAKDKEKQVKNQRNYNKIITDKLHACNVVWTKTAMHDGFQLIADYQNRKIWWLNWNSGFWGWWTFAKVRECKLNIQNKSWGGGYSAYSFGNTIVGQEHKPVTENSVFEIIIEINGDQPFVVSFNNLRGVFVTSEKFEQYVDFALQVQSIINEAPSA